MPSAYHDPTFRNEIWGLFAVGSAVLVTRLAVRLRTVGIRQFCGDDYITLLVLLCYVGDAVTVDRTYVLGTNVDFTQEWIMRMTPHERQHVITGSKLELLAWYSYTALIWALKACMLFFFGRLTNGLSMQTYVRYLSIVIGLSYVAVFLTITCGCLPIEKNWQITPDPGLKCTFKPQILYVASTLNIATDALILITPIPMLWNLNVTRRRKAGLSLLLFPGIFVIAAALIRVIMSLQVSPSALNINRWGVRETLAGVIAVNIPILRPMLRKTFWTPGPMLASQKKSNTSAFTDGNTNSGKRTWASSTGPFQRVQSRLGLDPERQGDVGMRSKNGVNIEMRDASDNYSNHSRGSGANSEEFIIPRPPTLHSGKDGVLIETTFGNTVEYRHQQSEPDMPWGHPEEKGNYISSVGHIGERDR